MDEEKKVEAVRDFYAHAAENRVAFASAERMLFLGKFICFGLLVDLMMDFMMDLMMGLMIDLIMDQTIDFMMDQMMDIIMDLLDFSARVGVPFCILAFSGIYWGYGLTMYMADN